MAEGAGPTNVRKYIHVVSRETTRTQATSETLDSFHDVSDVHPFHLPHIFNDCDGLAQGAECVLNSTTASARRAPHAERLSRGTRERERERARGSSRVLLSIRAQVTMPVYAALAGEGDGRYPVAAAEYRTKLKSRQAM